MATHAESPVPGLSGEVLVGAASFAASALVVAWTAVAPGEPRPVVGLVGWPAFALVGGILLDARPGSRPGRVLIGMALFPLVDLGWGILRFGQLTSSELTRAIGELAVWQAAIPLIVIPWSLRSPLVPPVKTKGLVAAAAVVVTAAACGAASAADIAQVPAVLRAAIWGTALAGCLVIWLLIFRSARDAGRAARRRIGCVLALLAAAELAVGAARLALPHEIADYVTASVLVAAVLLLAWLVVLEEFRPARDHLLDVAIVATTLVAIVLAAALVWLGARWTRVPSPGTSAAFSALLVAAMAVPAGRGVRRAVLIRRYGSGTIPPSDVATLTADLHVRTNPRDLLDKAARLVAGASGSRAVRIVLGADLPQPPAGWVSHPLVVADESVGAMFVDSGDAEGPELRQHRIIAQLAPTVALVARAVGLAVEAEHARRDVTRWRDAERRRILGDLHDGLGPVLAGMSMQVQAALRRERVDDVHSLLADLAVGLTASRTDLRRIVAGITPSVLDDGDLQCALRQLVDSFTTVSGGPLIRLDSQPDEVLDREVQVAVYRSVAEGVTNALRHGDPDTVTVRLRTRGGRVAVDVADDGVGGRVVPGVGLSSLSERARGLGGCLEVVAGDAGGTRLHLELPTRRVAAV